MTGRRRSRSRATLGLALAVLAAACAGEMNSSPSGPGRPTNPGQGGSSGATPGGSNGGSSEPGKGSGGSTGSGGSAAGTGGSSGSGGSAGGQQDAGIALPDASGSVDAAADAAAGDAAPQPFCAIAISPLAPQKLINVPAGESYRVRLGGMISGTQIPAKVTWRWEVTHPSGVIATTVVDGDPAIIEFPTLLDGVYKVRAELVGATPACTSSVTLNAIKPNQIINTYFVRVTPPAARTLPNATTSPLGVIEKDVYVQAGMPGHEVLEFQTSVPVRVDPTDDRQTALSAYFVQISSLTSTARYEGYVRSGETRAHGFSAQLYGPHRYDVLIVPEALTGEAERAPILYRGLLREQFAVQDFSVTRGVTVNGTLSREGVPLVDGRVRLRHSLSPSARDYLLPSTIGRSNAQGGFSLQVRPGRFEARVIPPADSGLPEALLPQSMGIDISESGPPGPVAFTYAALPMVNFSVAVNGPEGTAVTTPVSVTLEALPGELLGIGSFSVPGQGDVAADGVLHKVVDGAGGVVAFGQIPKARYRLTVVPPDTAAGSAAITTESVVDLTSASSTVARTITLGKRGQISGRLLPVARATGLVVRAVDAADDGIRRTVLAPVDAEGRFTIASDPGRVYRLFVEPAAGRRSPRLALEPAVRATAGTVATEHTLPDALSLSGEVRVGGTGVGGAIVQVFCAGSNVPTCVDRETGANLSATLPIDETVSAADGTYKLWLPDPGQQ